VSEKVRVDIPSNRMEKKYNTRSPAVKRLMREALEMSEATSDYTATPLEENLFEWHFTVRGPEDSDFQGGIYHGRILVPAEYPMKPPDIILLTPNGRFEVGKKICLSISGHHPETWQPSWSIRTALLAIIAFMPSPGQGTIGSLDYTGEERRALAKKSRGWSCQQCGDTAGALRQPEKGGRTEEQKAELEEIAQTVAFKSEEERTGGESTEREQREVDSKLSSASTSSVSSSVSAQTVTSSASSVTTVTTSTSSTTVTTSTSSTTVRSPASSPRAPERLTEGGTSRVYDLLMMLLVAGIAAILYRRFNFLQDTSD